MRLASFQARGFKNLLAPVELADLGTINVLHGQNNVGKSNLLQAMELFFALVGIQDETGIPLQSSTPLGEEQLSALGFPPSEIFNLEAPVPVRLEATLELAPEDFDKAGRRPSALQLERVRVAVELGWMGTHAAYSIPRFETADGRDFAKETRTGAEIQDLSLAATLIARSPTVATEPAFRFARIGLPRLDDEALALALYDAKDSPDLATSRGWDRFVDTMASFRDVMGEGRFIATYDRKAARANLLYQTARARIPLSLLGSGVQQIVALFGRILTSGAAIVAIEEPELNLRWALQERVRDALRDLAGKEGAPSQLFLTSHSGAFETRDTFYLMRPGPDGPVVEIRSVRDVPLVVGGAAPEGPVAASRAPAYVSGEGTLRLPDRIRDAIGVAHGGGVSFVDKGDGVVEMMSDDTLLRLAGIDDDA